MQTCDPLKARQWFKLRTPVNWAVSVVVFIPLVFLLQQALPFLLADAVAIALVFCLYFFYLHKRTIAIECPSCENHIETNTPWICGNKDRYCRNDQVDDFPFIHRCQHCGFIPKAYQCHHCGKLIFLSPDKQTVAYARCADVPVRTRPARPDPKAEKVARQNSEKHDLSHELEMTKIKAELRKEKANLEPPRKASLHDKYRSMINSEDEAARLKAQIDEEYQNDPVERAKRHAIVDDLMREML